MIPDESAAKNVLVVDDSPDVIDLLSGLLTPQYRVRAAADGETALKIILSEIPVDIVLLDHLMPDLTGIDILNQLSTTGLLQRIPIIMLTGAEDHLIESKALEMGAVDFVRKPISARVLMARVANHLELSRIRNLLAEEKDFLESEINRRVEEIQKLQDVTIMSLACLAEMRDLETGNHILRTQHYVRQLALLMRDNPRFSEVLTSRYIDLLFKSAPLHDIGKVGIPDRILLKPGPLTEEEMTFMKNHTLFGHDSLVRAEEMMNCSLPFFDVAKQIALCHHEKWDGSGYPRGLKGEEIPISARLMAIADVYDALVSRRCYKEPIAHEKVIEMIADLSGTHFDPEITQIFIEHEVLFHGIALKYQDEPEHEAQHTQ